MQKKFNSSMSSETDPGGYSSKLICRLWSPLTLSSDTGRCSELRSAGLNHGRRTYFLLTPYRDAVIVIVR